MAEKTVPTQWNEDPKNLAIAWIVGFILLSMINYFIFRWGLIGSLGEAFVLVTFVIVLRWLGVGLPKQGSAGKTGTKAA
jgi:hypothetical protein